MIIYQDESDLFGYKCIRFIADKDDHYVGHVWIQDTNHDIGRYDYIYLGESLSPTMAGQQLANLAIKLVYELQDFRTRQESKESDNS